MNFDVGHVPMCAAQLAAIEAEIELQFNSVTVLQKGCFGKLVRLTNSSICQACACGDTCQAELLRNGANQMIDAEAEIEKLVFDNQLQAELASMADRSMTPAEMGASPIAATILNAAKKVKVKTQPADGPPPSLDLAHLAHLGDDFDYSRVAGMILVEKPESLKRVYEICASIISVTFQNVKQSAKCADKLMSELVAVGAIQWNSATRKIEYSGG